MKKAVKLILILQLLFTNLIAQELSKKEAKADIFELKENLENYHAGLNRYTSADSMNYFFELVISRMEENTEVLDLYRNVTYLLNKVRCGHTRPRLSDSARAKFETNNRFLPVSVKYLENKLYINEVLKQTNEIKKGDEILSINGLAINSITQQIFEHLSSDGFIRESKFRFTERYFSYYYQLYINHGNASFNLQIKNTSEKISQVILNGVLWKEVESVQIPSSPQSILALKHEDIYSYMKIGTFVESYLTGDNTDFEAFLEDSFFELKEKGVKNLVLDLRGNGGGSDNLGALLVSYFADKSFKYFERIEVTDSYDGYGNVKNKDGRNLMTSHEGLSVWAPQKDRFTGNVFVLIDGFSFSTCADVATVLHYNNWATFIGRETGGGYDGNTSGYSKTLQLSNSGIRVNLPMWMYTTANLGHSFYGRGVIPDYPIKLTVSEFINEEDVALKEALKLMKSKEN